MEKQEYGIRLNKEYKFAYFVTPKTGSRSVFSIFGFRAQKKKLYIASDYVDYYKWGVVRNPWSRILSTYENKVKPKFGKLREFWDLSFEQFIRKLAKKNIDTFSQKACDGHIRPMYLTMPVSDMDFVCRIENFQDDFNTVCDKIGMTRQKLPQKNKTKHKHYTEYYSDETRGIVAEKYAKDIEYFGYEFGE